VGCDLSAFGTGEANEKRSTHSQSGGHMSLQAAIHLLALGRRAQKWTTKWTNCR